MNLKETLIKHRDELRICRDARANPQQIYAILEQQENELNDLLADLIARRIMEKIKPTHVTSGTRPLGKRL